MIMEMVLGTLVIFICLGLSKQMISRLLPFVCFLHFSSWKNKVALSKSKKCVRRSFLFLCLTNVPHWATSFLCISGNLLKRICHLPQHGAIFLELDEQQSVCLVFS